MELGSWSALSDGLNLRLFFFFFCGCPFLLKGAIQKENYCSLCRIAICIATLHKKIILDFENLKIYRSEIQPCDRMLKAT